MNRREWINPPKDQRAKSVNKNKHIILLLIVILLLFLFFMWMFSWLRSNSPTPELGALKHSTSHPIELRKTA